MRAEPAEAVAVRFRRRLDVIVLTQRHAGPAAAPRARLLAHRVDDRDHHRALRRDRAEPGGDCAIQPGVGPGARPGDELPKSLGHVHATPHGAVHGYPEIIEVLHGRIAFMIFDLRASVRGAIGERAWIVVGDPGDAIVLPPDLHHLTIVADHGPAVFADVIDRGATGDYAQLRAAGGGPYLARPSGALEANPRWAQHPSSRKTSITSKWG